MKRKYKISVLIFFILAIFLRVLLCLVNPPHNAFDNHFEPIFLIIKYGTIPAKDACWQCYHPPVFYWLSAMMGKLAIKMGANIAQLLKLFQFICCVYGILTVGIIYLILKKVQLTDFSRLFAFGAVCFLPRHIYMSAMHSNDTISYLFVAITIYLLIITIERKFSLINLIILSLAVTITLYTKYSSFVVLPIMVTVFLLAFRNLPAADKKKKAILFCLTLLLPLSILSASMFSNVKNYKKALPGNFEIITNPGAKQPRDEGGVSFLNFKPWKSISTPILVPGNLNSFWTLIYSGMWFDTEPKFLYFMDSDTAWWKHYYRWLRGEKKFPGDNPSMSKLTILEGSGLITLGLFPLGLFIIGCYRYLVGLGNGLTKSNWIESSKMSIFAVLLISNTIGIIVLTVKIPVYSTMKASYFLNSMPAFAVFLGMGVTTCENMNILRWATIIIFGTLFILACLHILHICMSVHFY